MDRCKLCHSFITEDKLPTKCLACNSKKGCPLNQVVCPSCQEKIMNHDKNVGDMYIALSKEEKIRFIFELRALYATAIDSILKSSPKNNTCDDAIKEIFKFINPN